MKKITGPGGVFIKAKDPKALAAWYQDAFGPDFNNNSYIDLPFTDEEGKLLPVITFYLFLKQTAIILTQVISR